MTKPGIGRAYEHAGKGLCRECNKNKISRPRLLCKRCHNTPSIRDKYPVDSKYAPTKTRTDIKKQEETKAQPKNNGLLGDFYGGYQLPEPITEDIPRGKIHIGGKLDGSVFEISEERLKILQERARRGLAVTHPKDR